MKLQSPRGTQDVLPPESYRWSKLESVFREVVGLYGYAEIRTPTFEDTQLFTRTAGETSDIVTKQMYSFKDKGDRDITLKPEGTAPALRAAIQHSLFAQGGLTRLFYITPFFRYERPQLGRFREAHQLGVELIGSGSPLADAEIIEITVRFFEAIGLSDLTVLLNSLGRRDCRLRYRESLLASVQTFLGTQPAEIQEKAQKNPLRLLDSKDPEVVEAMKSAPSILNYLEPESLVQFNELQRILDRRGIAYEIHPEIVRGLDYYNETVFEVKSSHLGAQGALCGGGRYDGLIQELGGPNLPSIGVGIGEERVLLVAEQLGLLGESVVPEVYLVTIGSQFDGHRDQLSQRLRSAGIKTVFDIDNKNLKSQMKDAARLKAQFVVMLGEDEFAGGYATVKIMASGEQINLPLDRVHENLKELSN